MLGIFNSRPTPDPQVSIASTRNRTRHNRTPARAPSHDRRHAPSHDRRHAPSRRRRRDRPRDRPRPRHGPLQTCPLRDLTPQGYPDHKLRARRLLPSSALRTCGKLRLIRCLSIHDLPLPLLSINEKLFIDQKIIGRSERIRTSGPLVPNEVRYQAALHSAAPPDLFSGRILRRSYNGA